MPLLYEGRFVDQSVNPETIDAWFERVAEDYTDAQKADLRRKYSRKNLLAQTESAIYARAEDISRHFKETWKGTGFKAQLVAPSTTSARSAPRS